MCPQEDGHVEIKSGCDSKNLRYKQIHSHNTLYHVRGTDIRIFIVYARKITYTI